MQGPCKVWLLCKCCHRVQACAKVIVVVQRQMRAQIANAVPSALIDARHHACMSAAPCLRSKQLLNACKLRVLGSQSIDTLPPRIAIVSLYLPYTGA